MATAMVKKRRRKMKSIGSSDELGLELIQTHMIQKPLLPPLGGGRKNIAVGRSGQKCVCACGDLRIAPLSACSI
jgi:hypothetical protein